MFSYLLPLLALTGTAFSVPAVSPAALNTTSAGTAICGSSPSTETFVAFEKAYAAKLAQGPGERAPSVVPGRGLPIHFRIITASDGRGNIPDSAIQQQVNVINQNFAAAGFTWNIASVQRIPNNVWYNQPIAENHPIGQQMKNALSQPGPVRPYELKVYLVAGAGPNNGAVAYSSFPMDFARAPTLDGIIMNHNAFFGGSLPDLGTGKILVHEMGHWCGLYHPFQGGCNQGDGVEDTPAEAIPATVCAPRDTCLGGGPDDITNHMDYTKDSCRNHFSLGQGIRMRGIMNQFRGIAA